MIKIFNRNEEWGGSKVNFIDDNNTLLGYDLEESCCEFASWYISDREEKESRDNQDNEFNLSYYNFDIDYIERFSDGNECQGVRFKIISNFGESLYIHLFNVHNGYYEHGFSFSTPKHTGAL